MWPLQEFLPQPSTPFCEVYGEALSPLRWASLSEATHHALSPYAKLIDGRPHADPSTGPQQTDASDRMRQAYEFLDPVGQRQFARMVHERYSSDFRFDAMT